MISSKSLAIAARVLRQLVRDIRTVILVLAVPLLIMSLLYYSFPGQSDILDPLYPALLATMGIFFSFLLTGVSFIRERSQGTMERIMASPLSRIDMVIGYLLGFFVLALIQMLIVVLFTVYVLDAYAAAGSVWQIIIFQVLLAALGVTMGIFASIFSRNDFQMIQTIPLNLFPQLFLGGVIWPIEQMHEILQWVANFLPLTYATEGMREIMLQGASLLDVGYEIGILFAFTIFFTILSAFTLRRRAA